MSKTTIPQSIFGDQTNIKRCVQPPGGNSTIMFGGESVKSDAVKGKDHQASDIFNLGEKKEVTKKPAHCQQGDTQNRLFGGESAKTAKEDGALKSYNPITGELRQDAVAKDETEQENKKANDKTEQENKKAKDETEQENKKDADAVSRVTTSSTTTTNTAAAGATSFRGRQPPGGRSTNLW